jgi:hypothetical protein
MRALAAGFRWVREIWREEWKLAHRTMAETRGRIRWKFLTRDVPLLLLLTSLIFLVGVVRR